MFLDDVPVNYVTVLIAALVYFVIGAIWYAPFFFGHRKHHDTATLTEAEHKHHFGPAVSYIGEFIISFIISYVLAIFMQVSQADDVLEGIAVAFWVWLGFIATTHFSAVLWDRKTLKSFFIHAGFMLVGFIAMGATIMYFEP